MGCVWDVEMKSFRENGVMCYVVMVEVNLYYKNGNDHPDVPCASGSLVQYELYSSTEKPEVKIRISTDRSHPGG